MPKLNFAQIDAKEYPVVTWDYNYSGRTAEEERLLLEAKLEYLEGVLELQAKIRAKYEPKIAALGVDAVAGRDMIVDTEGVWEAEDLHWDTSRERMDAVDHLYYA